MPLARLLKSASCSPSVTPRLADNRHTYTVVESTDAGSTCDVLLDRPLERTITARFDCRVPRPVWVHELGVAPQCSGSGVPSVGHVEGAGMLCAVMSANGIGVRVAIQDQINVGRVVAIDLLAGVAVLNATLCVPLLG